jgi:signal transduction histidine kinase
LLAALAYVLLLAIVAFGVPLGLNLSARVNAEVRTQAQIQAQLIAAAAGDLLTPAGRLELRTIARSAAGQLRGRVLILDSAGTVIVDSAGPGELGTSYATRPEVRGAVRGSAVQVERYSRTLGQEILATAVPIIHDRRRAGAVRVTQSVDAVHTQVLHAELAIGLVGLVVLAIGLGAGGVLAAQIGRPLRLLEAVARRVAHGDLSARAAIEGSAEQQSLASSFNDMTDRIVRLLSAQRDFVADASHQLRTPLTGLRLRLEEAKALAGDSDSAHELDAAMDEVDRLSHTVDELLLLSRASERQLAGTALDLGSVAAVARERWKAEARGRGITLEVTQEGDPGPVWAARSDIDRALDALVENALRYAPARTLVTIAVAPGRIEVRDAGPGISESERELVFERFRRGSAGRAGPAGHGLGLPIACELARAWNGEVTLEPRRSGGTSAILSLAPAGSEPEREAGFAPA